MAVKRTQEIANITTNYRVDMENGKSLKIHPQRTIDLL